MARVELRRIPLLGGCAGWIPRGPAGACGDVGKAVISPLAMLIGRPALVITDPFLEVAADAPAHRPRTIWIDLSLGERATWDRAESPFRQGVRKAKQSGVVVGQSRSQPDQDAFFALTQQISDQKKFDLVLSRGTLAALLSSGAQGAVSAHLFIARCEDAFAAAALIIKCGSSVHYISGGTDRSYSRQRVGEALHWSIIEWAIAAGAKLYDLEGIDPRRNPGTFAFKKKMGGREVVLAGKKYYALSGLGAAVAAVDRYRARVSFPFGG